MGRKGKRRVKRGVSPLEEHLATALTANGITGWEREFRFLSQRRFRFDFAWKEQRLAVEVQGGLWMRRGGHTSGAGVTRDCEKMNYAVLSGWRVLLFTSADVKSGVAIDWIKAALSRIGSGV